MTTPTYRTWNQRAQARRKSPSVADRLLAAAELLIDKPYTGLAQLHALELLNSAMHLGRTDSALLHDAAMTALQIRNNGHQHEHLIARADQLIKLFQVARQREQLLTIEHAEEGTAMLAESELRQ